MQERNWTIQKKTFYGNIAMYSPDGQLMFHTNERKAEFYIKKGLVESLGDGKYRLLFEPNGLGHALSNKHATNGRVSNPHCLIPRKDICVVSGETNVLKLTKHHIVPSLFRVHMPSNYKSNYQLVVLLERKIHSEYTCDEQRFYETLAEKYWVKPYKEFINGVSTRLMKISNTLFLHSNKMPKDRLLELKMEFQSTSGLYPSFENYAEIVNREVEDKRIRTSDNDFGAAIIAKVTDFDEFEMLWLNHFIEFAKPQYLPEDLVLTYL